MYETFWLISFQELYKNNNYLQIFPSKNQSKNELLNAIFRFSIYYSLILYFLTLNYKYLFVIPFVALFTIGLYYGTNKNKSFSLSNSNSKQLEALTSKDCAEPTLNNPFMNFNVLNSGAEENKSACNYSNNTDTKNKIKQYFDYKLIRTDEDIFDKNASDRQFYTMPNTDVVNDQNDFAMALYGRSKSCKENNGEQCYNNVYRYMKHT
jgi:hypothetical protein